MAADETDLPDPDGYVRDQGAPCAPLRPAYLARTVRRLIAERVAASRQATVNACNEAGRTFREMQEWRQRASGAEAAQKDDARDAARYRVLRDTPDARVHISGVGVCRGDGLDMAADLMLRAEREEDEHGR